MITRVIVNKPYPSTRKDKKLMIFVINPKTGRLNTIHFGQKGYASNKSKSSWEKYMKRSAAIRDKKGNLTRNNKLSANYWARKILWPSSKWKKRK